MRFSELMPLSACAINLAVTLFVLTRNLRARLNWVYLLWGFSITFWNLGVFFLFRVQDQSEALGWAKFVQLGVIFLPISLFHVCILVTQMPVPRLLYGLYALHVGLALTNFFTHWFVARVRYTGFAFYAVGGPAYWVFLGSYAFVAVRTTAMMYRRQRELPTFHGRRVRVLLGANVVLILFGTHDLFPILGLTKYPLTDRAIYPLGSLGAVIYGMLVGYGALQHELLDVRITLSRVAAHLVRVMFVVLSGFVVLALLRIAMPGVLSGFALVSALATVLVSATVASVCFPRLFGRSDEAVERWILADQFEYRDKVRRFIQAIPSYSDSEVLMSDLHELLVGTMRIARYKVLLLEETTGLFQVHRRHPESDLLTSIEIKADSPLVRLFRDTRAPSLPCGLAYSTPAETEVERAARAQLDRAAIEFCFPFASGQEPIGLLLVGEKTDHRLYSSHDQELLVALVQSLGLVLNQIRLKSQVILAAELELLGRMSRGMAHDLHNLVTPVWTILQLVKEDSLTPAAKADLLPLALRGIETIQAYIREALFVSERRSPQYEPCELVGLARETVAVHVPAAKAKGTKVTVQGAERVSAEVDPVLIQRLMSNLFANAIEATTNGAGVQVEWLHLAARETEPEWVRLRVIDHGVGMNPAHLEDITRPYFTTKPPQDGHRGFGLGLAICRKIAHLHGGQLTVLSQERKGTTVQVDLPARPPCAPPTHSPAPT